jgi:hypothetical protein
MEDIVLGSDGTASFGVNIKGSVTGSTYVGNFKVKCLLSPLEFIKSDKLYRELLGQYPDQAHSVARNNAFALSQLQFRVIECPPFWENREIGGGHIEDSNVLTEVMELAITAEERYREERKKEAEELQAILTKRIQDNKIEKKPEVETIDEKE